jgi:molybdopterin-containing oxidoreductase family iron-sulfur binding subunit
MDLLVRPSSVEGGQPDILPNPCMQCDNPPCTKVCPVGATYQNEEGLVVQVWDRCIGCRYCETACPYSRRYYNWQKPEWPESYKNFLNPDVATRPEGVVEKCTFCIHRIRHLREEKAAGKACRSRTRTRSA